MTEIALIHEWLSVLPEGRFDDFSGEVAEDFVLRLPFLPPGVPHEFKGRATAAQALQQSAKGRGPLTFSDHRILRTEDPELFMATCKGSARMNSGKLYQNEYIMLVRMRNGVVLEHVEYLNPLAVIASMGE